MEDFDWVRARAKCSSVEVFERLRLQVKADIEVRNKLLADQRGAFSMVEPENKPSFSVILCSNPLLGITFNLVEEKITVDHKGHPLFESTLTLCDDGQCRVKIKEQERELWQMRRMALEELFFGC